MRALRPIPKRRRRRRTALRNAVVRLHVARGARPGVRNPDTENTARDLARMAVHASIEALLAEAEGRTAD